MLVVGGGPAGLEAALTLGRRGFRVTLAEARREFGGRLLWESRLPGLRQWFRVADYRLGQLRRMANVSLHAESPMGPGDVHDFGADHVVVATGARWTANLCGANEIPTVPIEAPRVHTPDDIAAGAALEGPVAVFDFDNYYMGSAIAEHLAAQGLAVTYVTSAGAAQAWGIMTNEQPQVHQAFRRAGIASRTLQIVESFDGERLVLAHIFSGERQEIAARSLVIAGQREGGSPLFEALRASVPSVVLTGDANAPGAIAHAVWQAHRTARELGAAAEPVRRDAPFALRDIAPFGEAAQ